MSEDDEDAQRERAKRLQEAQRVFQDTQSDQAARDAAQDIIKEELGALIAAITDKARSAAGNDNG